MKIAAVIPVGPGRLENLVAVLHSLAAQTRLHDLVVIVDDGMHLGPRFLENPEYQFAERRVPAEISGRISILRTRKHEPGMEQPRNLGVRHALALRPDLTHAHFVDSDVLLDQIAVELLHDEMAGPDAVVVCPYDWMPEGQREPMHQLYNDPRWPMFKASPTTRRYENDLSAGLACFSGNLVWPVEEFVNVGGYWSEIHHGRCEDGELGLRAVAMGVPISLHGGVRGWHMGHDVNHALALERNARDVPMLNARHPWVEGADVFMVDRDGKAFDVRCRGCQQMIPTNGWWAHAPSCAGLGLPVTT